MGNGNLNPSVRAVLALAAIAYLLAAAAIAF